MGCDKEWYNLLGDLAVSIHAPRVGCDFRIYCLSLQQTVSIHAPRVGCDDTQNALYSIQPKFQFTHPVWGATVGVIGVVQDDGVSIHAPRVGCDLAQI